MTECVEPAAPAELARQHRRRGSEAGVLGLAQVTACGASKSSVHGFTHDGRSGRDRMP